MMKVLPKTKKEAREEKEFEPFIKNKLNREKEIESQLLRELFNACFERRVKLISYDCQRGVNNGVISTISTITFQVYGELNTKIY
jgi:hypothetical protein